MTLTTPKSHLRQPENGRPSPTCPLCGRDNHCAGAQGIADRAQCWCTDTVISQEALARVPAEHRDHTCICPRCASGDVPAGQREDQGDQ